MNAFSAKRDSLKTNVYSNILDSVIIRNKRQIIRLNNQVKEISNMRKMTHYNTKKKRTENQRSDVNQ